MNLLQTLAVDFFDLDALEPDRRIIARAMLKFYVIVALLALVMVLVAQFVLVDASYYTVRMVIAWGWLGLLVVAIALTRKGYLLWSSIAVSTALVMLLLVDLWRAGGLTLLSIAAILPLLLLTFLDARRAIFVCGTLITLVLSAAHIGLEWAGHAEHYVHHHAGALSSFVMAMAGSMWVTHLSARVTGQNVEDVARKTRELEQARGKEHSRRLEAEEIRRASVLAGQAKGRFLSNMSHELRTPLNAILGYAEMLEEDLEEVEQLEQDYAQDAVRIQHSARHLLGLINDILDLSRLEADKMPVRREVVSCEALRDDIIERCNAYRRGTLEVRIDARTQACVVYHDRVSLVQLVVQAVLERGGLGVLAITSTRDEILLEFTPSVHGAEEVTDSLLELRTLLREALVDLLDVEFVEREHGWSIHLAPHAPA